MNGVIANIPDCDREGGDTEANAAFIVRACNVHNDLLAVAKAAKVWAGDTRGEPQVSLVDFRRMISAALAKAEVK